MNPTEKKKNKKTETKREREREQQIYDKWNGEYILDYANAQFEHHTHTYTILSRILLELSLHLRYFTHIPWQTTWKSPLHTENVLNPPIPDMFHFDSFIRAIAVLLSHCFHLVVWSALLPLVCSSEVLSAVAFLVV